MKNLYKYYLISLKGLLLDVLFYSVCIYVFSLSIFIANIMSSFIAISFVYFQSTKNIFDKESSINSFFLYLSYQIISINVYSYVISFIDETHIFNPLLSKILTIPFSFITNYLFMKTLSKFLSDKRTK